MKCQCNLFTHVTCKSVEAGAKKKKLKRKDEEMKNKEWSTVNNEINKEAVRGRERNRMKQKVNPPPPRSQTLNATLVEG